MERYALRQPMVIKPKVEDFIEQFGALAHAGDMTFCSQEILLRLEPGNVRCAASAQNIVSIHQNTPATANTIGQHRGARYILNCQ